MRRVLINVLISAALFLIPYSSGLDCVYAATEPIAITVEQNGFDSNNVGGDSSNTLLWQKGNAYTSGGQLVFTNGSNQAGSVVKRNQIKLNNGFSTYFQVYFSGQADGIAFVLYKADSPKLGDRGGYLGYGDATSVTGPNAIRNSIIVEFDTWDNTEFKDNSNNHVAIMFDGNPRHDQQSDSGAARSTALTLAGNTIHAWVDYNASTGLVTTTFGTTNVRANGITITRSATGYADAPMSGDSVFVGFTSATGSNSITHKLIKWYFKDSFVEGGLSIASDTYSQAASTISINLSQQVNPTTATISLNSASGVAMANQDFKIEIDGVQYGETYNTGDSAQYTWNIPNNLEGGTHTLRAIALGGATNSSTFYTGKSVTYYGNGSTGGSVPSTSYHSSGSVMTVAGNTGNLTRGSFSFDGWNTSPDGLGTSYAAGSGQLTLSTNTKLYAQWKAIGTSAGSTTFSKGGSAVSVDSGLTVADQTGTYTSAKVSIRNLKSGDQLSYSTINGITGSYNSSTGVLTLSGTASGATFQSSLRTILFSTTSSDRQTRNIDFSLGSSLYNSDNGHFYEYVSTASTWSSAKSSAASKSMNGRQGYLATITSSAENNFIFNKLKADAWIGSSDDYSQINSSTSPALSYANQGAAEGRWYWVTGPEAGTLFSIGNVNPQAQNGIYTNWNSSEPNNSSSNEHYGEIYSSSNGAGRWNDLPNSSTLGFVVEYGGLASDTPILMQASKEIDVVTVPGTPTNISAVAGNGQATVSFSPPSDNGGRTVTSYTVLSSPGNLSSNGSSSPITITGLTNGTSYTFTVKATNGVGDSDPSTSSNAITPYVPYTITFDSQGGSAVSSIGGILSGQLVSAPSSPTRTGYSFVGWYKESGVTNAWSFGSETVTSSRTLYAKWTPNANTAYKIEHYQQDASGSGYTKVETDSLSGTTGAQATAIPKNYTGFTENTSHPSRLASSGISADGSLVLKLYYNRNTYTVQFQSNGGSSVNALSGIRYDATITAPTPPALLGYVFDGWYQEATLINSWSFATNKVMQGITLYANWAPSPNTTYYVEHYQETVAGDGYTLFETENKTGTTASTATGQSKSYTGFTENTTHNNRLTSAAIAADGSMKLRLYYDRMTYSVQFDSNGGTPVTSLAGIRYQNTIPSPEPPTRTGYSFDGWYRERSTTNAWAFANDGVTAQVTLYAKWNPNTDTTYRVQHYFQNTTGTGYALNSTQDLSGTTDATASAIPRNEYGFHENTGHLDRLSQSVLLADGTLVLKLYYDRNTYTVSFLSNGGTSVTSQTVRYNTTASAVTDPSRTGYTFGGWYQDSSLTAAWSFGNHLVTTDAALYAKWTPNTDTAYRVEHYLQNVTGNGYTLADTENREGTTENTATASPKSFTGFIENPNHTGRLTSAAISADGSLALKFYYDRATNTVSFQSNQGTTVSNLLGIRFDATITEPSSPTRTGYGFEGWYKEDTLSNAWVFSSDTVTTNTALYAKWTPNSNTVYRVEHYQQDVSGTGYTKFETVLKYGTTAAIVIAEGQAYSGFSINNSHPDILTEGGVEATGSLILKVYYDRLTYQVQFNSNGGSSVNAFSGIRYDATITAPTPPALTGYAFGGWFSNAELDNDWDFSRETVKQSTTLYAKWTPSTNTPYTVYHYIQNENGDDYTLMDTENLHGTTASHVEASDKAYTGFLFNNTNQNGVPSGNVEANGSLVLKLYYDRETYHITYTSNGGSSYYEQSGVRYGATLTPPETPARVGYTFDAWYTDTNLSTNWSFPNDRVTDSVTLYAGWTPNADTGYTVEHYQQDVSGDGYSRAESEQNTGTTATSATASPKTYPGFSENTSHRDRTESGNIAADGSLILKFYYDRNTHSVLLEPGNGLTGSSITGVRYGATIEQPAPPELTGFSFGGWYKEESFQNEWNFYQDVVTTDVALYAKWTIYQNPRRNNSKEKPITVVTADGETIRTGTETLSTVGGQSTVSIKIDPSGALDAIQTITNSSGEQPVRSFIVPIANQNADNVQVKMTGDIVKALTEKDFLISVDRGNIAYIVGAKDLQVGEVARQFGTSEDRIQNIQYQIRIQEVPDQTQSLYETIVARAGGDILYPATGFVIQANFMKTDGMEQSVDVHQFSSYARRVIEMPAGIDPSEITTGIVFRQDGSFRHVPTLIYQQGGKWFVQINSLTNSDYTVVSHNALVPSVERHWSKTIVNDMANRFVLTDVEHFQPDQKITRAEFATYIVNALGLQQMNPSSAIKFTDIAEQDPDSVAIQVAYQYGIIQGYPDHTFRPDQKITRQEAMVMFSKAMKVVDLAGSEPSRYRAYKDYGTIQNWAAPYVKEVLSAKVFQGTSATTLSPNANLTHAESLTAIRNLLVESGLINEQ